MFSAICARGGAITAFLAVIGLATSLVTVAARAQDSGHKADPATPGKVAAERVLVMPNAPYLRMPEMDAAKGRTLFVTKGCVACHSINGVGGHDGARLDAGTMDPMMNPFDFAAKMWRMAPVMIAAQEEELGEQIYFTGDELSDIVAFVHDVEEQKKFTEADLTPEARHMMGKHYHEGMDEEHDHDHDGDKPHQH